ncbi:hypothetical protein IVB69_11095 [Flavobacterium sp. J49]|uniref:hypothetical protein n=1 Tax=Flavobacterium sp. J49 TaxID=2718534 RepID=UPI001592E624|nr:hypothetical protein [Flavobacterium sp. J49]MBF6642028.1 hypothetical protein [Flavobacterium sp. J49]NIC03276.1 hypothetical protein [Flavobacterium sp. J49]
MLIVLFLLVIIIFMSIIAFLIGLYKVLFDKEDRAFGIKLLTYSVITMIIGFGSCTALLESGAI